MPGDRPPLPVGIARVCPSAFCLKLKPEIFKPKKITYATIEYVDVGGLAKEKARESASLAQLREVDALAHVVRAFENPVVPHPAGSVDPLLRRRGLES